jgi:hypothetical protein
VLFNGASEQHIEPHFMTVPPPYRWLRLPCFPSPDEDFLASTLVDDPDRFAYDLLRNTNCWRHGHLPCSAMAAMAQSLPPGAPGPLPPPLPLFLTCRRIYEEAAFRFYHLSVGGIFRLEQFLGCLTEPTLDRIVSITLNSNELPSALLYPTEGLRTACQMLADGEYILPQP